MGFSPETPFLTEYHGEAPINLETQALEQTLMETFDRDFNEAVSGFAMEAAAQVEHFSSSASPAAAEQSLQKWLDPLRRATEQLLEQAGDAATREQLGRAPATTLAP